MPNKETIKKPRGTRDILPDEQKYWEFVENTASARCKAFNFGKITTPAFESLKLFQRGVGNETDVVEKEMYEVRRLNSTSSDNEQDTLVLRPEGTAGIARSYIEKGMQTWVQPVKLYYFEPMYRYDRPQKGRFREFWQFSIEIFGDNQPFTDATVILLLWQILTDLGFTKNDIIIDINSIGCKTCRDKIRKKLIAYFEKYQNILCADCQRRMQANPLRLLDCKEERCQKIAKPAPQIIDNLCNDCKNHFKEILELLDDVDIPYNLKPNLVRGLDYYTRTTFEVRSVADDCSQNVLGGGGRYDDLIELLGGRSTPAIGFSLGVERMIDLIKEKKIKVPEIKKSQVFVIQIGDKAKKKALAILQQLSQKGIAASCAFGKASLKSQLRSADKSGAALAIIIGQREALDNTVIIRDMRDSTQETVDFDSMESIIIKKIIINKQSN